MYNFHNFVLFLQIGCVVRFKGWVPLYFQVPHSIVSSALRQDCPQRDLRGQEQARSVQAGDLRAGLLAEHDVTDNRKSDREK